MSNEARAALGAAAVLVVLICAVEISDGPHAHYAGWLAAVPFLAAAFTP